MTQVCLPAGCTRLARVARIEECSGVPEPGANNGYWFECFRAITWEPTVEEGDTVTLQNDCNKVCWSLTECDELVQYAIALEALNPDYELESLLTGWPTIVDGGGDTIGINRDAAVDCQPWLLLELFEEVPKDVCETGHELRRIVFPKIRFRPPGNTRDEQFRLPTWTAITAPSYTAAYGTGPWEDSAIDFSSADPTQKTHVLEYFDTSLDPDTLEGECGYVEVPVPA